MDISEFDTFDDVIYDIGNRYIHIDMSIFLAKNGHIDLDISKIDIGNDVIKFIDFRYVHIDIPNFRYTSLFTRSRK